jgi:hypothetical protein
VGGSCRAAVCHSSKSSANNHPQVPRLPRRFSTGYRLKLAWQELPGNRWYMTFPTDPSLNELLSEQDYVIDTASASSWLSRDALDWRVRSGRWQRPARGVFIAHNGRLMDEQVLQVAVLWGGPGAALGGLTAATLDGLTGFDGKTPWGTCAVHLVVPRGRKPRVWNLEFPLAVHYSRNLGPADVHPARSPRRTRIARSLVDAASWMPTDRGAVAVLAAGVQQQLVRVGDLTAVVARNTRLRRRRLIGEALNDIACGAQALSELDFTRLVIREFQLPEPDRQSARRDSSGRRRYLDVVWERWKVAVEIDGATHMDALQYWDDMERDIDLSLDGYCTLRFPAFLVRAHPDVVAAKIRKALHKNGCPI